MPHHQKRMPHHRKRMGNVIFIIFWGGSTCGRRGRRVVGFAGGGEADDRAGQRLHVEHAPDQPGVPELAGEHLLVFVDGRRRRLLHLEELLDLLH
eukprot:13818920-Heterocapsa_arctica.AAC.1